MRTNKINNNQPSFGIVYARVKGNGTKSLEEFTVKCNQITSTFSRENDKHILRSNVGTFDWNVESENNFRYIQYHGNSLNSKKPIDKVPTHKNGIWELAIESESKKDSLAPNYKAETRIIRKIKKFITKNNLGTVEITRD